MHESKITLLTLRFFPYRKKLRIGYFMTDGKFMSHPGCTRAVKEAVAMLRKLGHTVVEVRR